MAQNLVLRPERPDPDELLRKVMAEEARERRAKLKVFLGYASGVGKLDWRCVSWVTDSRIAGRAS
jgi:two-component system, OmpR family, sensor histidine kinase KdpD